MDGQCIAADKPADAIAALGGLIGQLGGQPAVSSMDEFERWMSGSPRLVLNPNRRP